MTYIVVFAVRIVIYLYALLNITMEFHAKGPVYIDLERRELINPDVAGQQVPIRQITNQLANQRPLVAKARRGYNEKVYQTKQSDKYQQRVSLPPEEVNRPGVKLVRTAIDPQYVPSSEEESYVSRLARAGGKFYIYREGAVIYYHGEHEPILSSVKKFDARESRWNSPTFLEMFRECYATPPPPGSYILAHPEIASVSYLPPYPHLITFDDNSEYPYEPLEGGEPGVYRSHPLTPEEAINWLKQGENVVVKFAPRGVQPWTTILVSDAYNRRKAVRGDQSVLTGFYKFAREHMCDPAVQREFLASIDPYHRAQYADLPELVEKHLSSMEEWWSDEAWRNTLPANRKLEKYVDDGVLDIKEMAADGQFYTIYNALARERNHYEYERKKMTLGEKAGLDE